VSDRSLQKPSYPKVQKLANDKAIATLAKTTPSDRSLQKPSHPEAQKPPNNQAIAILIKTTQSERSHLAKPHLP